MLILRCDLVQRRRLWKFLDYFNDNIYRFVLLLRIIVPRARFILREANARDGYSPRRLGYNHF